MDEALNFLWVVFVSSICLLFFVVFFFKYDILWISIYTCEEKYLSTKALAANCLSWSMGPNFMAHTLQRIPYTAAYYSLTGRFMMTVASATRPALGRF